MNVEPLIPSDSLTKFLPPVPITFCLAGLGILFQKERMLPPRDTTMIPLNWKLSLPPGHFGVLMSLNQWAMKGVTVLFKVIYSDYQRERGILLYNGGRKE